MTSSSGTQPDASSVSSQVAVGDFRDTHVGHWLQLALQKFDARVLELMARHTDLPLALAHLAARGQLNASHIHITRHLAAQGCGLTELARCAQMSKQAMGKLVEQCEAWGLVSKIADTRDGRAKRVQFTADGQVWLRVFEQSVAQAQAELGVAVGQEVAAVIGLGLEAYVA